MHGTDEFTIDIERGMPDNEEIVFPRAGDQSRDIDTTPGDVIYTLKTQPHSLFSRYVSLLS